MKTHRFLWVFLVVSLLLLCVLLFTPQPARSAEVEAPRYVLVPEQSKLKFIVLQNSAPVEGAFRRFTADIRFDADHPEKSSITAEVDLSSVFAANTDVAAELVKPEWFNVAQFPRALLTTTTITLMPSRENDDRRYYYADAELTLRGQTVPVVLNFILEHAGGDIAVATGRMSLQRTDFGVGQGAWSATDTVEDAVAVTFRIVAKRVTDK